MLDQIRRQIQDHLEELLGEIDKLRRALTALTSRDGEPADGDRAAAVDSSAADQSAAKTSGAATRRAPRRRKASVPPRPTAQPASPAAAPARTRTAPGATKAAVLAALNEGSAMTAGEIAAATGLGRATVSSTLSKLATSRAITKAARGYRLRHDSDAADVEGGGETDTRD
jgi:DNA-binding transcriptional ArsR family regulator